MKLQHLVLQLQVRVRHIKPKMLQPCTALASSALFLIGPIVGGCAEPVSDRNDLGTERSALAESSDARSYGFEVEAGPRQTDSEGKPLPFEVRFEDRWNRANDGTAYEPCTGLDAQGLGRLGLLPASVEDAALVDGQSLRGCRWGYEPRSDLRSLSQFVGNSPNGLESVKARPSSPGDTWLPDTEINGRVVGLRTQQRGGECATFVESGEAVVITMVLDMPPALPDTELCTLALRFTEATIDRMPL